MRRVKRQASHIAPLQVPSVLLPRLGNRVTVIAKRLQVAIIEEQPLITLVRYLVISNGSRSDAITLLAHATQGLTL